MVTTTKAEQLSRAFERRTRDDGTEFVTLKDGSPDWMRDACMAAHGEMFPDDWRYKLIERCADALSDAFAEGRSVEDARDSLEPDIYTGQLTLWLGSRADRYGYCDEAFDEYGEQFTGTIALLQRGQMWEIEEVFGQLVSALGIDENA